MPLPYEPYTVRDVLIEGYWLWTSFVFMFGACIGSFLNVCIYRIPKELSVVAPRSHCPRCENMIVWYDNIPLLSWLALGGKCRRCSVKISPRYFLVEFLTGALFTVAWLKLDLGGGQYVGLVGTANAWLIPVYWLVIAGLVVGTFVDFDYMILPDRITLGGVVCGLILSAVLPELQGKETWVQGLAWSAVGAVAGGGLLWLIAKIGSFVFKKEAMGMGDVKLLAAIGAFFGWSAVLFSIMISSFFGSIAGITMVAFRKKGMRSRIPYGPYIAMAALVWVFWGQTIWMWYLSLFRPDLAI